MNRTIALFDNDTAATDAMRQLATIPLPANIVAMQYPDLELATAYPTIGPSGTSSLDIKGLACSVELYLGEDCLRDDEGHLVPVQWTGYNRNLRKYQGEVMDKKQIQDRFSDKLAACERDPSKIDGYDWSGIHLILDAVRSAFHTQDAERILGDDTRY